MCRLPRLLVVLSIGLISFFSHAQDAVVQGNTVLKSLSSGALSQAPSSDYLSIKIPKISEEDVRYHYPADLLTFLLKKTSVAYELQKTDQRYSQARAVQSLKENKIQLFWMGTSSKSEQELLPIRFPIYKGLMGYRLFLIHRDQQAKFKNVRLLEDLKPFIGMQGIGWSDIEILNHSGLIQSEHEYEHIFQLIQAKRGDYFSRGLLEVFLEWDKNKGRFPDLMVDEHVLLTYPHVLFFFTGKQNQHLADTLSKAFELAYEDGSFDQFFTNHPAIKEGFERAKLDQRLKLTIDNPTLSKETLAIDKKYWYSM